MSNGLTETGRKHGRNYRASRGARGYEKLRLASSRKSQEKKNWGRKGKELNDKVGKTYDFEQKLYNFMLGM